jgi:hypothetical protein
MAFYDRDYMRLSAASNAGLRPLVRGASRNLASTITAVALAIAAAYSFVAHNPNAELRAYLVRGHGEAHADEIIASMSPEQRQMMLQIARFTQQTEQFVGGR